MSTKSMGAFKIKGLEFASSIRKGDMWLVLFIPFALGVAFADVAAVPLTLICYKGATNFKSRPIVCAVSVLLGIMLGGDITDVIMSFFALIVALTSNLIFETSDEGSNFRNYLHGGVVAAVLMIIGYSINGLTFMKFLYACFYGLATYFGIYSFKKAGEGLGLSKKKITTDDSMFFVGSVMVASLMIFPEFSINIFGIENVVLPIRTIACVVYVFHTIRKCRISSAVAISAIGGLLLGISKNDLMLATLYATDFAVVSLLTGVFSVYGFKVLLVMFLFSLNVIPMFTQGAIASFSWLELAVIAALCIANEWLRHKGVFTKREMSNIVRGEMNQVQNNLSADGDENSNSSSTNSNIYLNANSIKVNGIVSEKFDKLAECIRNIGNVFDEKMDSANMKRNVYSMSYLLTRISKNVCGKCACYSFCWEHSKCETGRAIVDAVQMCGMKRRCVVKDVPEKFKNRCENLPLIMEEINVMVECARQEKLADLRLCETKHCMKEQLVGLSNLVSQMAAELKYNVDKNLLSEFAIEEELGREFGDAEVSIVTDGNGHSEVEVIPLDSTENRFAWDEHEVADVVSNMLDKKMVSAGVKLNSNLTVAARFVEKTKYKVVAGVAAMNKGERQISGDSFISEKIGYSKFLCGICDGMGAGEEASKYSDFSIGLLKNLVDADVSLENAVDMVNRMNLFKSNGEVFTTLDTCFVDLYDGSVSFVKAGAAPSFVVRENGEKVELISTEKMPLGLEEANAFDIKNAQLRGGDCVVLMSDGVYEKLCEMVAARENENEETLLCELISTLVKKKGSVDVKFTANEILSFAAESNILGKAVGAEYDVYPNVESDVTDDMTVMFLKLWQKY